MRKTLLKVEVGGGVRSLGHHRAPGGRGRVARGAGHVARGRPPTSPRPPSRSTASCCARASTRRAARWPWPGGAEGAGVAAEELARDMSALGFRHLVYTDIARDGMQTGIEAAAYVRMAEAFGHPVIASGGVAGVDDIVSFGRGGRQHRGRHRGTRRVRGRAVGAGGRARLRRGHAPSRGRRRPGEPLWNVSPTCLVRSASGFFASAIAAKARRSVPWAREENLERQACREVPRAASARPSLR